MTLLEVLLAMGVLALGLFATAALQVRALQVLDNTRRDSQAIHLAQGLLERARAAGRLEAGEQAGWQARIRQVLGGAAEGRVRRSGANVVLEIHWLEAREGTQQSVSLQGRVLP
ncbi:hypothetical protein NJI34_39135 [Pseudomonas sp. S 311-6]|nr:hypothetical protein [Pseudomonas guariconensis]MCO7642790.1 hypothetical protein [Pseudomonas sp. S 311-6]